MKLKRRVYYIDPKSETIGDDILRFRVLSGMTQWDLADKIRTDPVTISSWENYRHRPDVKSLHKINKFLAQYWDKRNDAGLGNWPVNRHKEVLVSPEENRSNETEEEEGEEGPEFYEGLEKIEMEKD